MKNQFDSVEHHTEWTAYELARQDAIETVEGVKNPYLIKSRHNGFEYARSAIVAALKSEE